MKKIKLTNGLVALVDDEDFEELNQYKWQAHWSDHVRSYYAMRSETKSDGRQRTVQMHREILKISRRHILIDHKNHDTLDNRKANLRLCNYQQNGGNKRKRPGLTSPFKGVSFDRKSNKWRAAIKVNYQQKNLGFYENPADAARAYDRAALDAFGDFAKTNADLGLL